MRITKDVARRFLLGRQGLWPGRRFRGIEGAADAIRTMGDLQLDPLLVVARAQDLALHARVLDYRPDDWARLTYEQRRFFEWGGWLAVRAIEELPYYRVLMRRARTWGRLGHIIEGYELGPTLDEMRALLRAGRELSNRDFKMGSRTRVESYRSRKDSGLALHWLWRIGEAMVVRRERFERVYALTERVAPKRYLREAGDDETNDFLLHKQIAFAGFAKLRGVNGTLHLDIDRKWVDAWRARQLAAGTIAELEVEGLTGPYVVLAKDVATIRTLERGQIPKAWTPLEVTTEDEVTFLSPLDPVIADRERTRRLFDFDYLWEVYTKPEKRRFGYYVLPILWRDRIVARIDVKPDRAAGELVVQGLWYEDQALASDPAFAAALEQGLDRLCRFAFAEQR